MSPSVALIMVEALRDARLILSQIAADKTVPEYVRVSRKLCANLYMARLDLILKSKESDGRLTFNSCRSGV